MTHLHEQPRTIPATLCFIVIAIVTSTLFVGCSSPSGAITSGTPHMITVGVITPLTGDFGSYGVDVERGVGMAIEDLTAAHPSTLIHAVFEDACLPAESLRSAKKLIEVDSVDFISGVFCIVSVAPLASLSEPLNMSVMVAAASPDSVRDAGRNVFTTNIAIRDEATSQADFAVQTLGATSASVVYIDTPFGVDYNRYFTKRFEERGGRVLAHEKLDIFGPDFKTQLTKASVNHPDVILTVHLGTQMGLLLKQAKELGISAQLIGTYEDEDPVIIASAGDSAKGFIISTPSSVHKSDAETRFEERFSRRFGVLPTLIAKSAYDGVMIQTTAYLNCNGERACIARAIGMVKGYNGASGTFSMGPDRAAIKPIRFKRVVQGAFQDIS